MVFKARDLVTCRDWFGSNTYWKRASIVQKILLAPYVFIIHGLNAIDLVDARQPLCDDPRLLKPSPGQGSWKVLFHLGGVFEEQGPIDVKTPKFTLLKGSGSLLENLAKFHEHQCNEDRDKMFATSLLVCGSQSDPDPRAYWV